MINTQQTGAFIGRLRRERNMTQADLAGVLGVTYQAVSKWENGVALPEVELLLELAQCFSVTIEEILAGARKVKDQLTYAQAGVDISITDAIKKEIAPLLATPNPRVLNGLGPFASLYDLNFPELQHPVLVLKAEEPGSKQKLAFQYGYVESVGHDLVNHLVNDIIVMGAQPLAVLDTIIVGRAEPQTVTAIVKGMADACRNNDCELVGGEISVQPGVVADGTYILTASIAGIVEKERIIDGYGIKPGDHVLAVASNGLHTNGYSLLRLLMQRNSELAKIQLGSETFLDAIMRPHRSYYHELKALQGLTAIHGIAHITGGGIPGNLVRILPAGCRAVIDLPQIKVLPLFQLIREQGNVAAEEMMAHLILGWGWFWW